MALTACAGHGVAERPPSPPAPGAATDNAIAVAQAKLKVDPKDQGGLDALAEAYLQKARESGDPSYYPKADLLLQQALKQQPADSNALVPAGSLALSRHQFGAALELGRRALLANPSSARALGVVADAQTELGLYPEAVATVQRMVDLRPDLSSYARVSYQRELHGDTAGAIAAMRQAVEAGGPVPENVAYTEVLLGNLHFNAGDLKAAEAAYARALASYPAYPPGLAAMGSVRAAQGKVPEAVAMYQRAISLYPSPLFVIALGDLQTASGDSAGAARSYELAEAENRLYKVNGVDVDAEQALFAVDHGRDLSGALETARRAVQERPSVIVHDVLAWVLYQNGLFEPALVESRAARQLGTRSSLFLFHAGMIEAKLGRNQDARRDLEEALRLNPHFSVLQAPAAERMLAGIPAA